jgi:hypothetical protein
MQKTILIIGIGHSGSTILDMALGCHPDVVGLGEVSKVLRTPLNEYATRYEKGRCSCGEVSRDCGFWSGFLDWLEKNPNQRVEKKYEELIRYFQSRYGSKTVLLDSSKTVRPYMAHLNRNHDVRVIFLVRDIRSWVHSRHTREGQGLLRLVFRWWRGNHRTERFIRRHGLQMMLLGYEELAIYPREMLEKVCNFLEIGFKEEMLRPAASQSHIIRGNTARVDKEKVAEIRYDARWMTSTRLMLQAFLFWPFLTANRRWVYSNIITGRTRAFGRTQDEVMLFGNKRKEEVTKSLGADLVRHQETPPSVDDPRH